MFENICINEKDPSERECNESANETSGLQEGVKIMAIPYRKNKAMCSPTSALEKKMGEEPLLMDSNKFIVERYWDHES